MTKQAEFPLGYSSEEIARMYLEQLGWKPEKTKPKEHKDKGIPDFKCSKNRWVEIKSTTGNGISIEQLEYWHKLIFNGDAVYLLVTKRQHDKSIIKSFKRITNLSLESITP